MRYSKWFSYLGAFTLTEMLTHGAVYKKQVYEVFLECYCWPGGGSRNASIMENLSKVYFVFLS